MDQQDRCTLRLELLSTNNIRFKSSGHVLRPSYIRTLGNRDKRGPEQRQILLEPMGRMREIKSMACDKCRRRRDSLYHLSHTRLVLPSNKLARLVCLEPTCTGSRESKHVLGFRLYRQLYLALSSF